MFVCQLWSCWVQIGVSVLTLIRKHTLQLVVWRCHSACPHLLVNHTHPNAKNMLHVCLWVVHPPVDLVISGTDWCWCADNDKEAHLSFTDGINTWHAHIFVLDFTLHANNVFSIYFGPSIVKLCTDHICLQLSCLFVLSLYVTC